MKLIGLNRTLAWVALSALVTGGLGVACSSGSSGDGDGGEGGDAAGGEGGEGGGTASGGKGGSGGKNSSTGGSGGKSSGGSGGSSSGGSGGGGAPGSGGMGGGSGGTNSAGKPKWCDDKTWYVGAHEGLHNAAQLAMSKGAAAPAGPAGMAIAAGTNYDSGWVPMQYAAAKDGEVGLLIVTSQYETTPVAGQVKNIIAAGDVPPLLIAHASFNLDQPAKVKDLVMEMKTKYPKLNTNPQYISIAGQSTAGAQAFDIAWAESTTVGGVITGSGSFVCFRPNAPYPMLISSNAKKDLRLSMVVGNCDIFGTYLLRMMAGCPGEANDGTVDGSQCMATWFDANKAMLDAMTAKGYKAQLLHTGTQAAPQGHTLGTWLGNLSNQLRFIYAPVVCK